MDEERQRLLAEASRPPGGPSFIGSVTGSPACAEICYNLNTMTDPPFLKLVEPNSNPPDSEEFIPLPHFPWDVRPSHLPLDVEEVATALYLAQGLVARAAERLKVEPLRVVRAISRQRRLSGLHNELASFLNDKVHEEYVSAFKASDDRRREWASSKVSQTKQFQGHPLAPNSNVTTPLAALGGLAGHADCDQLGGSRRRPVIDHEPAEDS